LSAAAAAAAMLQLYFADRERRTQIEFRGVKLDRFVYHSLSDGCALFSVHVPTPGEYFLEIFANKVRGAIRPYA